MKTKTLVAKPLKVAESQPTLLRAPEASGQPPAAQQPEPLVPQGLTLQALTNAQKVATGLASLSSSLGEAAQRASFSIGFGVLGLAGVWLWAEQSGEVGSIPVALLSIGAFYVLATIGRLLDRWARTR